MQIDSKTMLSLTFNVEQANLILDALGAQTYSKVSGLIEEIHRQANIQLKHISELPEFTETAES